MLRSGKYSILFNNMTSNTNHIHQFGLHYRPLTICNTLDISMNTWYDQSIWNFFFAALHISKTSFYYQIFIMNWKESYHYILIIRIVQYILSSCKSYNRPPSLFHCRRCQVMTRIMHFLTKREFWNSMMSSERFNMVVLVIISRKWPGLGKYTLYDQITQAYKMRL